MYSLLIRGREGDNNLMRDGIYLLTTRPSSVHVVRRRPTGISSIISLPYLGACARPRVNLYPFVRIRAAREQTPGAR